MKRSFFDYSFDIIYGSTRFPCALFRPEVYLGVSIENFYQRVFYNYLSSSGFSRTVWQLVFPGQVAGVIKKVEPNRDGLKEYHVRFYNDSIIDCEFEYDRFSSLHWAGKRIHSISFLEDILNKSNINYELKAGIKHLFGVRDYSDLCIRK